MVKHERVSRYFENGCSHTKPGCSDDDRDIKDDTSSTHNTNNDETSNTEASDNDRNKKDFSTSQNINLRNMLIRAYSFITASITTSFYISKLA